MLLDSATSQLVLIDYQVKLMPVIFENEFILNNAKMLSKLAKKMRVPVFGTEQLPEKLGSLDPELAGYCRSVLVKSSFSACPEGLIDVLTAVPVSTNARSLPKHLKKEEPQNERTSIVLAGVEAHVCLLQTALDLLDNELEVWIVTDACSSRTERNRDAAFDRLAGAGAELVTTEMVMFEWLQSAENEHFKFALEMIK